MSDRAPRVVLEPPSSADAAEFVTAVERSRALHGPYVAPPATPQAFRVYARRAKDHKHRGFLVRDAETRELAGVINLNEIVRGAFQSAYLGYYAFVPAAGTGRMAAGLDAVVRKAFTSEKLHRLEANIQPENAASVALVRRLGFRKEGFSPRYLKVAGRWRDHERWALTADDWRSARRSR